MYRSNRRFILAAFVIMATAGAHAANARQAGQAKPLKGEELAKDARITVNQARTIALKAHAGTITDEELEKEKGGSGLRYSFDIKDSAGTHEVGVDAKTGKVLENKLEGPDAD